jgi:membrane-associated phospholipid phosphatase
MRHGITEMEAGLWSLGLFAIVTLLVFSGRLQALDAEAALLVNGYDLGSLGTSLMQLFTNYGRELVWGLLVLVMFLFGNRNTKILALELGVLFLVGTLVGDLSKILLPRPRPFPTVPVTLRIPNETESSYPSGHALIVSIGAAFCLASFRRRIVAGLLTIEAGIVCYSRVYLGVHYPLDVAGGVFLGMAIALVGASLLRKYAKPRLSRVAEAAERLLWEGRLDL